MPSSSSEKGVTAEYTSPTLSHHTFRQNLPACSSAPSTKERTEFLSALRSSIGKMQDDVNVFLTKKIEEDKLAESSATANPEEAKAEEFYGEEEAIEE